MLLERAQQVAIVAALRAIAQQGWGDPDKRPTWAHDVMTDGDHDISLDRRALEDLAALFYKSDVAVNVGPYTPPDRNVNGVPKHSYRLHSDEWFDIVTPKGDFVCKAPNHVEAQEVCDALDLAAEARRPKPPTVLGNGGFIEANRNVLIPWYVEKPQAVADHKLKEGERLACDWATPAVLFKSEERYYVARPDEVTLVPPKSQKPGLVVEPGDDPTGEES